MCSPGSGTELSPRFLMGVLKISLQHQTKGKMPQHRSAVFSDTEYTVEVFQRRRTWLQPVTFVLPRGG